LCLLLKCSRAFWELSLKVIFWIDMVFVMCLAMLLSILWLNVCFWILYYYIYCGFHICEPFVWSLVCWCICSNFQLFCHVQNKSWLEFCFESWGLHCGKVYLPTPFQLQLCVNTLHLWVLNKDNFKEMDIIKLVIISIFGRSAKKCVVGVKWLESLIYSSFILFP
jgi:hypothetical protein